MNALLESTPATISQYHAWLRDGIAWCERHLRDDSRAACRFSAQLVNAAKAHAYNLRKIRLADVLPARILKNPVDAALRLREALAFEDGIDGAIVRQTMTAKEAATVLGISTDKVYELVKANELPHKRIGRAIRFRSADLEAYQRDTEGPRLRVLR